MIPLHRLGHAVDSFQINPDAILTVEATPDTVITLLNGQKVVVAEPLERVADEHERLELRLVPNVDLHKLRFGAEFAQFLLERFAVFFATACNYNVGACRGKSHCRCAANARKGSGDQNNLFRHNNSLTSAVLRAALRAHPHARDRTQHAP